MPSVHFVSMGCFKNLVDTERMAGRLAELGFDVADQQDSADICVINTCGFIEDAVKENISVLLDAAEMKSNGSFKRVVAAGCLVSRYGIDALARDMPEIDSWVMPEDLDALADAVGVRTRPKGCTARRARLSGCPAHVRYLKITEGCSNRCTYCTIPSIRGDVRSSSVSDAVCEAQALVEDGARELCIVGQDLTAYGGGDPSALIELLDALESSLPRGVWLRMLYLHPKGVTREIIERAASGGMVLPYLDIPIQHASERVLASMGRGMSRSDLLAIFKTAREIREDFALRTTLMVGFPGETRSDVASMIEFLEEVRFDRAGAFVFSPEEGTPAAAMDGQVSKRTKLSRLARLMERQEMISASRSAYFLGRTLDVIIDSCDGGSAEGRSFREAPEVDGVIEIDLDGVRVSPGDVIQVEVADTYEHDMRARAIRRV